MTAAAWTSSASSGAATSAAAGGSTSNLDRDSIEVLRDTAIANRSRERTTPTPAPTATATPAPTPTPTPTVAPIVGTFTPVPGCTAVVPSATPPNGQLDDDQLCSFGDGQLLRADAAATFVALNSAFQAEFGSAICVTDSYRSYSSQVSLYHQKPSLAAVPGTSNHGWGVAVDLFCGIDSYSSAEHAWMTANASRYGWTNPPWARHGGSREEPWHWEFDRSLLG